MASKRPPNIRVPGRGGGRGIPPGYLVGRVSARHGPAELLKITDIRAAAAATAAGAGGANGGAGAAGFTATMNGHPTANGRAGPITWADSTIFAASCTITGTCTFAPTSNVVWTLTAMIAGVPTTVLTITWEAGQTGPPVLSVPAGSFTLPAGTPTYIQQPASPDATFADATATVTGVSGSA